MEEMTTRELSVLDTDVVLRCVATYAISLVKADLAYIASYDKRSQKAKVQVVQGARTDRLQKLLVMPNCGTGGQVLATGKPFVTMNYLEDPGIAHDTAEDQAVQEEKIISVLVVPIFLKGDTVGLLWVANRTSRDFTQEDVQALQKLIQQVFIILENARLYQDLQGSHQELLTVKADLVRKTRIATIGEIAAALDHEARNLLGALRTCLQILRRNPHIAGEDVELLDIIQTGSQRLNEIVSELSAFGRPGPLEFQEVGLHGLIDETFARLQRDDRCPSSIVLVRQFDPSLRYVQADRDQLGRALWNLFLNAVQAMGQQGELRVETQRAVRGVKILVRDTGPGIPATVLPNIFDPLYSTKSGGIGLGLAIVRRIVEEHGGQIAVDSKHKTGTCLVVTLPLKP